MYPASSKAFWYSSLAASNSSLELEMVFSLFAVKTGMFLRMGGGWLDALLTYLVIPFGFLYGLYHPSVPGVTSKKTLLLYADLQMVPFKNAVEGFFVLVYQRAVSIFNTYEAIISV